MPLSFNTIVRAEGIDPKGVRLLRHQDKRTTKGRTIYCVPALTIMRAT